MLSCAMEGQLFKLSPEAWAVVGILVVVIAALVRWAGDLRAAFNFGLGRR